MIIPWNTDAPIYHGPWATIGLIVVNTLVLVGMMANGYEGADDWMLVYGDGLHPLQWVTSNFMHGGVLHLVGNMLFLWGFGLVVEGKLGWWKFLAAYMAMGVVQSGIEQMLMLGADEGGSLGASSIIFGLMGMALVWAPKNEMNCVGFFFRLRPTMFDVSILVFSVIHVAIEIVMAFVAGLTVTSALLHLSGAALGFVLGVALLKLDIVDCENWDLFAVWADRAGKPAERIAKEKASPLESKEELAAKRESALEQLQRMLETGTAGAAAAFARRLSETLNGWQVPEVELIRLIKGLDAERQWNDVLPWMVDYLRRFPDKSARMRLRLAQILLIEQKRPAQAQAVLAKLDRQTLPADHERLRADLAQKATQMQEDSAAFELGVEDW